MKISAVIAGDPRFNEDFDKQLNALKDYEVDWYGCFWKVYSDTPGYPRNHYLPPAWKATTNDEARAFIEPKLPANHKLVHVEVIDRKEFPSELLSKPWQNVHTTLEHQLRQYWILNRAEKSRQAIGNPCDLLIRTRNDVDVYPSVDLQSIYNQSLTNPNHIEFAFAPRDAGAGFVDLFVAGAPDAMKIHLTQIEQYEEYNIRRGVWMSPQLIVMGILSGNGITYSVIPNTSVTLNDNGWWIPGYVPPFGQWNE